MTILLVNALEKRDILCQNKVSVIVSFEVVEDEEIGI